MAAHDDSRDLLNLDAALRVLDATASVEAIGRVHSAVGTVVRATLPGTAIGEAATIVTRAGHDDVLAQVVGFEADDVLLMPLGTPRRRSARKPGAPHRAPPPDHRRGRTLGRVVDALGQAIDGGPPLGDANPGVVRWPIVRQAPARPRARPHRHPRLDRTARHRRAAHPRLWQRIGIFSPAGAGKSALLAQLAQSGGFDAVVVGLVGERGREVRAFVDTLRSSSSTAPPSTLVVATSDQPAQARVACALSATSIAEYLREERGMNVLLCIDSLTRVAPRPARSRPRRR